MGNRAGAEPMRGFLRTLALDASLLLAVGAVAVASTLIGGAVDLTRERR
jgi:hypothetical protein